MIFLLALLLAQAEPNAQVSAAEPTTVILVRHAEKATDNPNDPGLSREGQARAAALADMLSRRKIGAVIVSDTKRAKETGEPTAAAHHLDEIAVPVAGGGEDHVKSVVGAIRQAPNGSTMLVVGHSNTLAPIIAALGGPQVKNLCEKQFAPMYVLELPEGSAPTLTTKSYGEPDPSGADKCGD